MEKLKMHTENIADKNFETLSKLFPNVVTETINENGEVVRAIDADVLRQEISCSVVEGKDEKYQFTWPDKLKTNINANIPITSTLRPCISESREFDTTENLYIEGDNLDVIKLLRETYLGKIKMIYIDPPYNTGNDFIYNDDFSKDRMEYLLNSGQLDEEGNQLVANTESNGRFHTDWLNMIYSRIKLSRDLLSEDGVIFISIDDNEVSNIRKICDELFGTHNFISQIIVQTNPRGRTFDKFIAKTHEYVLVYVKNSEYEGVYQIPKDEKSIAQYNKEDEYGKYRLLELRNRNPVFNRSNRPKMFYPFYADPSKLDVKLEPDEKHTVEIYPRNSEGLDGCWTWGLEKTNKYMDLLVANLANTGKWSVFRKDYLEGSSLYTKSKAIWLEPEMNHENGKEMVGKLFGNTPFDFPKSVDYIKKCILLGTKKDSIVMDFFSGSATTAQSVMQLNSEDGGNRKFILVQLPENSSTNLVANESGYNTICDIGKQRIRLAGDYIKNNGNINIDFGFRVLKLDSSNMKDVYYTPTETQQTLFDSFSDNIKEDRTPEDLLFQVMLDLGVLLSSKIEEIEVAGKKIFNVADGFLIACFDKDVTEETVKAVAEKKPYYAVFRDSSMANDSVATNFDQIFEAMSPDTIRKVL